MILDAAKIVKKVQPQTVKSTSRVGSANSTSKSSAEQMKRRQTVAELANTYVKMLSRPTTRDSRTLTRSKSKGKTPTPTVNKKLAATKVS